MRRCWPLLLLIGSTARTFLWEALLLSTLGCFTEQTIQMRIDIKARLERVLSRIGCHLGAIEVQLFAPHESRRLTLLHNLVKEAAEDIDPIALTDTGEIRMIGQGFPQVIP